MMLVPAIIIVNVVVLSIAALNFMLPSASILDKLSNLPAAWGACLGALLGLCGVAWTTKKGFENLIKAQSHRAEIERAAREHQGQLNDNAAREAKNAQARTVAAALMAEFTTLLNDIHSQMTILRTQIALLRAAGRNPPASMLSLRPATWHVPIWEKVMPDIGLLGPSIAGDVFSIYSRTRFKNTGEQVAFPDEKMAMAVYEHMHSNFLEWTEDLVFVNARLGAFFRGVEDTGSLYNSPQSKARREKLAIELSSF